MKKQALVAAMLLAATTTVGAADADALSICKAHDQRCTETCELDKVLWLFKGTAYENCAQRCDTQLGACLAEDLDVDTFEVILPRSAYGDRDVQEKPSLEAYEIETGN